MMVSRIVLLLSALTIVLAACGTAEPPTAGDLQTHATACDKSSDGKRIALEGYLRFPESFSGKTSVVLRLYQQLDFNDQPVGVQITIGKAANNVEQVSDQFMDEDLRVHIATGDLIPFGTKVKVSGKVYYPLVAQDFVCALENPLVETAN